jgi:hypothetical protein
MPNTNSKAVETRRYSALDAWTNKLSSLQNVMLAKAANAGGGERMSGMPGLSTMLPYGIPAGGMTGTDWA